MSGYSQAIHALPVRPCAAGLVSLPASLLLPSFGVIVFAVTLLEVLFLSQGAQALFRDSDTGWHVRNGEAIIESYALPRVDPFSFTRSGEQWFAWEWLSDVVFAVIHRAAGLPGVALLAALAIALTAWGAARLALSLGANLFLTAATMIVLLGTTSIHWLARPHILSWPLALAFLAVAEHARRGRSRMLYALPLLSCLWANVHGSFLLGPAILLIYAIGDLFRGYVRSKRYALCNTALLSLLATFINPYGWRLHQHVIGYLQNAYLMDRIAEFRSFSFHTPGAYYVELFLLIAIVGIVALFLQRAYAPALLGIALIHMSLYSARHFPTAAVLLLPLAAAALTREARERDWLRPLLQYCDRLRDIDRRVLGTVPLAIFMIAALAGTSALARAGAVEFNPAMFPVKAADFIESNDLAQRIFSKDQWGGYLIYRFGGRTKVFIDGRSDFYGREFLEEYTRVADVKPAWNTVLEQYGVGVVLVPTEHALSSVLQLSPEWRRIYTDSVATIFERVVEP
jgi:hypothetical protein